MLLAILYCKQEGIEFMLNSEYWNSAYERGWDDYFEPFCRSVSSNLLDANYLFCNITLRSRLSIWRKKLSLALKEKKIILINVDVWPHIWNVSFTKKTFNDGQGDESCFDLCRHILNTIWIYNSNTKKSVFDLMRSATPKTPYFTIHVRRGDKIREAPHAQVDRYIQLANRLSKSPIPNCHVMTDDYEVVCELRQKFRDLNFFSLCLPDSRGHDQNIFNSSSSPSRKINTINLLADLNLAMEGVFFVGTFSSNVGRLVALRRGLESTFSVDIPYAMKV